jgi:hypothetical protein
MGALLVLSLKSNNLHAEGGKALAAGLKGNQGITELDISDNCLGLNSDYGADTSGVIAIADAIPDMGALLVLSLKKNSLGTKEAGKALGEMLKVNSVLKKLDLSDNYVASYDGGGDASGFAQELALGIKDNGAISTVIVNTLLRPISNQPYPIQDIKSKSELNFSGKELNVEDAIIIAALIPSNVSRTMFLRPCCH